MNIDTLHRFCLLTEPSGTVAQYQFEGVGGNPKTVTVSEEGSTILMRLAAPASTEVILVMVTVTSASASDEA